MQQTALSIVQAFCSRANQPAPSTLVGTITDPGVLQIRELLYAVCEELRQARCWPQQKKTHTFATVATQSSYQLPPDFYATLPLTEYDRANTLDIQAIGDEQAAYNLYRLQLASGNYQYRLVGFDENSASAGGQFSLIPAPGAAANITFEYLSRDLFIPKNWTPSTDVTITTSYCNANGKKYICSQSGTTDATTAPSHTAGSVLDGTAKWTPYTTAYETLIADTDLCIFDADLVKLGLRAKYLEDNGGSYQQPKAEFESKITSAAARMYPARVGSFSKRRKGPRYVTPKGGWTI